VDFSGLSDALGNSPLTAIPLLFIGGLLTSLTPCIYPMIPITVALVGQESLGPKRSRWKPLLLTLSYVFGLATVYAILGVIAGMSGSIFGSISSNPWLYFLQANVLMLAGLFMLDVFTFSLPASTMEWATRVGTGGHYGGAFAMGSVSGLVAAPCGAPVMAAVLTWVTRTQSAVLGFIYLFVFSLGMCALLVVVGVSSGSASGLPKAGAWMMRVKRVFGFVMLGVAEYYLIKMGQVLL
jgi:cytochrome c-type biogenesis protein